MIANTLKLALASSPKLLLTATPLQNSLLELYGLVSFIDEHAFGDLRSFREQYSYLSEDGTFDQLKARLRPLCHRTLRRQVTAYVPYTNRHAIVEQFTPAESEDRLYHAISEYLQRDNLQALPASQRSLMTLVLRKLLASSTFAIAGALETLIARLKATLMREQPEPLEEALDEDYETLDETAEEWPDEPGEERMSLEEVAALRREIDDMEAFRDLATSIKHNAKGLALLTALGKALEEARRLGAAEKAIVFTESRKTQAYIERLLADIASHGASRPHMLSPSVLGATRNHPMLWHAIRDLPHSVLVYRGVWDQSGPGFLTRVVRDHGHFRDVVPFHWALFEQGKEAATAHGGAFVFVQAKPAEVVA